MSNTPLSTCCIDRRSDSMGREMRIDMKEESTVATKMQKSASIAKLYSASLNPAKSSSI